MKTSLLLLLSFMFASTANATIFVPSYGSSGDQSYSYTFLEEEFYNITIGVSNEGDFGVDSYLALTNFGGLLSSESDQTLDTGANVSTSAFINATGDSGTDGELLTFTDVWAYEDDTISFTWNFSTDDYVPFADFAFVDIEGVNYEVLAQIGGGGGSIPEPASIALLGLGLLGFGLSRRRKSA